MTSKNKKPSDTEKPDHRKDAKRSTMRVRQGGITIIDPDKDSVSDEKTETQT